MPAVGASTGSESPFRGLSELHQMRCPHTSMLPIASAVSLAALTSSPRKDDGRAAGSLEASFFQHGGD